MNDAPPDPNAIANPKTNYPPISPELRERILSDPNIAKIAQQTGGNLEEFVKSIGYHINNPDAPPLLVTLPDEMIEKELGFKPPTLDEMMTRLKSLLGVATAGKTTGFDPTKKKLVEIPAEVPSGSPVAVSSAPSNALEEEVKKARMNRKG
jgi:hypothetical protein